MSLEEPKQAVESLSPEEMEQLRDWLDQQATTDRLRELLKSTIRPTGPRRIGVAKGEFVVPDSFFDPLPDDILDAFEGRK